MPPPNSTEVSPSRPELTEKISSIEKAILTIVVQNDAQTTARKLADERTEESLSNAISEIRAQRKHYDTVILHNRKHFDERIDKCNKSMVTLLKTEYMTKAEIDSMRDTFFLLISDRRRSEIKEAKVEVLKSVEKDVKIVYHQLNQFKRLLYGIVTVVILLAGIVVSYFKD